MVKVSPAFAPDPVVSTVNFTLVMSHTWCGVDWPSRDVFSTVMPVTTLTSFALAAVGMERSAPRLSASVQMSVRIPGTLRRTPIGEEVVMKLSLRVEPWALFKCGHVWGMVPMA